MVSNIPVIEAVVLVRLMQVLDCGNRHQSFGRVTLDKWFAAYSPLF